MMRGTVCSNAGTYGSVGTVGEQSPTVTWSVELSSEALTAGETTSAFAFTGTFAHVARVEFGSGWSYICFIDDFPPAKEIHLVASVCRGGTIGSLRVGIHGPKGRFE